MSELWAKQNSATTLLLCAAIVGGPLAAGGAPAAVQLLLSLLIGSAAFHWARPGRRLPTWGLLPAGLAAVLLIQVVPLPESVLQFVAPFSAMAWAQAGRLDSGFSPISVDPGTTLLAIRQVFVGLLLVVLVANLSRVPRERHRLITAVVIAGGLILALGVAFPRRPATPDNPSTLLGVISMRGPVDFWKTPVKPPVETAGFSRPDMITAGKYSYLVDAWPVGDCFGPYIDSNKFAGGVVLTLPLVMAAIRVSAARLSLPGSLAWVSALSIWAAGAWLVGWVGDSRAGTLSLLLAGGVTVTLSTNLGRFQGVLWAVVLGYLVALVILLAVFLGPLQHLIALLPDDWQPWCRSLMNDERVSASRAAVAMFCASPAFGTGLGTYGQLNQSFTTAGVPMYFAHNDIFQLAAEAGVVGLLIAAVLAAILIQRQAAVWRQHEQREWATAGIIGSLTGIVFYSFLDWNLHLPGNRILACVLAGLALSPVATSPSRTDSLTPQVAARRWPWQNLFIQSVLLCLMATAVRDANSSAAEKSLRSTLARVQWSQRHPQQPFPQPELRRAVRLGEQAMRYDSSNASLNILLGQAELHLAAAQGIVPYNATEHFKAAQRLRAFCRGMPEETPPIGGH